MTKNEKDRVSIPFYSGVIKTQDRQVQSQPDDTKSVFLNYLLSPDDEEKARESLKRITKEAFPRFEVVPDETKIGGRGFDP